VERMAEARRRRSPRFIPGSCTKGMVIVGVPYSCQGLVNMDEISGGTPYGATTLAKADGSRQPSESELVIARFQGEHVARIAQKLAA